MYWMGSGKQAGQMKLSIPCNFSNSDWQNLHSENDLEKVEQLIEGT